MERKVHFFSDGFKMAGVLFSPEGAVDRSCPGIVMCQGRVGVKEYFWFPRIARHFASLGYVVLTFDYRGVGESEGQRGRLFPLEQVEDTRSGLTYLESHPKVDPERLALYGMSYGGALVPYVAAVDQRVRCAISAVGWGDGERWMRSLRRHWEWLQLLDRVAKDRRARVLTGKPELPLPSDNPTDSPSAIDARDRIISKIPEMESYKSTANSLATMEKTLEFKPIEVVARIASRAILYIAAEKDTITPADGVIDMYTQTKEPKKLWVIPNIGHYNVYEESYLGQIIEMATGWLGQHTRARG